MIKLTNILSEILNTYQVEAYMLTNNSFNITDVLDQIRAIRKITIVRNITPEDYVQDIETSDMSKTDLRVPGVKSFKYKPETLRRL